jgi:hypothetical protein
MVVEPSGFATDWAGSSMTIDEIPPEYDATVGALHTRVRQGSVAAGDPVRAAEIIVKTVAREHPPTHLLVGVNAVEMALAYSQRQIDEATEWAAVGRSADFAEPYPVELPPDVAPS